MRKALALLSLFCLGLIACTSQTKAPWETLPEAQKTVYTERYACPEVTAFVNGELRTWPVVAFASGENNPVPLEDGSYVVLRSPSGQLTSGPHGIYVYKMKKGKEVILVGKYLSGNKFQQFIEYNVLRALNSGKFAPDEEGLRKVLELAEGKYFCLMK